ncbi:hypothetical protein LCGC14_0754380 [marine sediment metagenome]|uniref:Uncharacterized protein n=1 Tax=marine sediment metagenome TaxID=412755 RepID=A0A0F9TA46_9ZZZZ
MSGNELLTPGPDVATELSAPAPGSALQIPPGGTMQQVRGSYSTAVQVQQPRNINGVQTAVLAEARMAGETFYYGWGAGKNLIEGGSIGLAMAMARCWGNCAIETLPVQDTADAWIFTTAFVDLESGCTVSRQFRQSKRSVVYGKHDEERKDDMRFAIGQSKAARNVILSALPKWLKDQAIAHAKRGVREKIEKYINTNGLPGAIEVLMKALKKEGISEDQVLAKFEIASISGMGVDQLVVLRGDLMAIQEGQESVGNLFPDLEGEALSTELQAKLAKKRKAAAAEAPSAESQQQPTTEPEQSAAKGDDYDSQDEKEFRSNYYEAILGATTTKQVEGYRQRAEKAQKDEEISSDTLKAVMGYCADRIEAIKKKSGK